MIETVIVPAAVLFFLATWMVAEEATFRRTIERISAVPQMPQPEPTPEVTTPKRKGWIF